PLASAYSVHRRPASAPDTSTGRLVAGAAATGLRKQEAEGGWGGLWLLPLILGAVSGAAMFPGEAFPLAGGYVVALLALGDRRRALAASLGCMLAMTQAVGPLRLAEQLLILSLAWLISIVYKGPELATGRATGRLSASRAPQPPAVHWRLRLGVFLGTLLLRVGMLYVIRAQWEMMLWAGGESLLELGAAFALIPAVSLHQSWPQRLESRHVGGLL